MLVNIPYMEHMGYELPNIANRLFILCYNCFLLLTRNYYYQNHPFWMPLSARSWVGVHPLACQPSVWCECCLDVLITGHSLGSTLSTIPVIHPPYVWSMNPPCLEYRDSTQLVQPCSTRPIWPIWCSASPAFAFQSHCDHCNPNIYHKETLDNVKEPHVQRGCFLHDFQSRNVAHWPFETYWQPTLRASNHTHTHWL